MPTYGDRTTITEANAWSGYTRNYKHWGTGGLQHLVRECVITIGVRTEECGKTTTTCAKKISKTT